QADWLIRYYGFVADEILSKDNPFLDYRVDPKCFWAINHLDRFPVEINTAPVEVLLRVPGIGPTGVKRIISARRYGSINFEMLKRMHVVLKRARFFITCNGKMLNKVPMDDRYILNQIADVDRRDTYRITDQNNGFRQLNLFDDLKLERA
ncbi:MAG: radical SAM protein, partial [Lachnospiraceae bacterium]|nr:radical SAM protein [Lachnospiraceae bacterium]